jgi:hypothetical protein
VSARWKTRIDTDLSLFRSLRIFALRWFILGDGRSLGTGTQAPHEDTDPSRTGQWRFDDVPSLSQQFLDDFEFLLRRCGAGNPPLKIVPSLISFEWCWPGHREREGVVHGGRSDVIVDDRKRPLFWQRVLQPLLDVSARHRDRIYAWELINEPEGGTMPGSGDPPEGDVTDPAKGAGRCPRREHMVAFISEGIGRINAAGFKSTVGYRRLDTIRNWNADRHYLGVTLHQFHYYAKKFNWNGRRWSYDSWELPAHSFSRDYPCFIGEFATARHEAWPGLQNDNVYSRLRSIQNKNYPAAFLWSMNATDSATSWSAGVQDMVRRYTSGR